MVMLTELLRFEIEDGECRRCEGAHHAQELHPGDSVGPGYDDKKTIDFAVLLPILRVRGRYHGTFS